MAFKYYILSVDPIEFDDFISNLTEGHRVVSVNEKTTLRIWFKDCGDLRDSIDESPVMLIHYPERITDYLWKTAEVCVPQPSIKRNLPNYYRASEQARKTIKSLDCVWESKTNEQYSYYLRGSIMNYASKVYTLKSGRDYLEKQFHFVHTQDNNFVIENVLKSLRLLGLSNP